VEASVSRCIYLNLRQFETLDLSFQEEFEKFLQERGINESLAFFIPEYAQHKEQKVEDSTILSYALMTDVWL
jgi:complement component 1 Q subcomponent-binding protein